jgi:hypothetical protein
VVEMSHGQALSGFARATPPDSMENPCIKPFSEEWSNFKEAECTQDFVAEEDDVPF